MPSLEPLSVLEFFDLLSEKNRRLSARQPGVSDIVSIRVGERNNFTVIVITQKSGEIYVGLAKKDPVDTAPAITGRRVAANRVLREICGLDPQYGTRRGVKPQRESIGVRIIYQP